MSGERAVTAPSLVVLAGGLAKRYGGCKPLAPAGLHGEAVIDLTVSDALRAGFGDVVIVLGPQTASAIRYHVGRCWPASAAVSFAVQTVPLGTAHALLCTRRYLGERAFAVVNADDIYGVPALELLAGHLAAGGDDPDLPQAMVAFALEDTIVTDKPVTRGTCVVDACGELSAIIERRRVTMRPEGTFTVHDGLEPPELDPRTPVSVNLWGFTPAIWPVIEAAVAAAQPGVGPDGSVVDEERISPDDEVLLPEVIGDMVGATASERERSHVVLVLDAPGRCLGVTHAEDLPIVRSELAAMVGQGLRPESVWDAPD